MKDEAKRKVLDRRVLETEKREKAAVLIRGFSVFSHSRLPYPQPNFTSERNVRRWLAHRKWKEIQAAKIMAGAESLDLRGATFAPIVLHQTFWDQFRELRPNLHKISEPAYHCVARFEVSPISWA